MDLCSLVCPVKCFSGQNLYGKVKKLYGKVINLYGKIKMSGKMKEIVLKKRGKVKNLYGNVKNLYRKVKNL